MKSTFSFRNLFLVVAVISSLLLTACGGGGGGGGSTPTQQTSSVKVTIPGSLFPQTVTEARAATSLEKLTLKVVAYSNGKEKTDVKITDREATSNGTNFVATVDGLLNVYDYRFIVFHNSTELLSNQVAASEIVNDANIKINIETSYKTIAYDSWLKKKPTNASMSNFKENSKTAGFTKDSDYKKLTLKIGNDEYTADQYKENLIKAAKNDPKDPASLPTDSNAKINVDKIATTDKESEIVTYTISYNLDGGTVSKANPTKYDSASATITLNNPTKDGFNFTGWTGSNGNTPQTTVTIPKGSTGNKTFKANWAQISNTVYSISYNIVGGTLAKANPTQYDAASATITLNNPTKDGFNFTGWTGSNGNTPQTTVTISKGSSGDKTYTANWAPISYSLTYNLDGGILSKANPTNYDITSATITLNNPTKDGYNFKGWTGSNGDTPQTSVKIQKGSTGNKTYTANWAKKNLLEGSGTANDPFIVASADDLNKLRQINNGSYFKQTKDIDLSSYGKNYDDGNGWLPIPYTDSTDTTSVWYGNYDGNNHKITNLYIYRNSSMLGLFGNIASDSVISNINIETSSDGISGIGPMGIIAGISNSKSVSNCSVKGLLVGMDSNVGGMFGISYCQSITNCNASCTLYIGKVNNKPEGHFGGLIGYQLGDSYSISDCVSKTHIISEVKNVGGMIGYCSGNGTINSCKTSGYVETSDSFSGGFSAYVSSHITINNCISTTTAVAGDSYAGGFVGCNYGTISLCFSEKPALAEGLGVVGGFVGSNNGNISRSYSKDKVTAASDNDVGSVGGFAGENRKTISNCYSLGDVLAVSYNGKVMLTGGFVGDNNKGDLNNCYTVGNVRGIHYWSGGIAGKNNGTISNCFALGSMVYANSMAGRVSGDNTGTISNCYAISTMTVNDEIPSTNIGTDKINGASVTTSTYQNKNWWLNTLGFSSSIWSYSTTNKRMELNNMPSL